MILAAVAAADKGHDDAHLSERQFENFGDLFLQRRWRLAGRMDDQLAAGFPISRDDMQLDMTVLHRRHTVAILDDSVGVGESRFDIAAGDMINAVDIAASVFVDMLFVNDRRIALLALSRISVAAGNSSYSTSIRRSASSAISTVSAATAATIAPT